MTTTQPPACGKISDERLRFHFKYTAIFTANPNSIYQTYLYTEQDVAELHAICGELLSHRHPAPVADERADINDLLNDHQHAVRGYDADRNKYTLEALNDARKAIIALSAQPSGALEHLEPVPHIATLINNNQPGWTNIIETAPNVTIDVGTKLYDQKALFAVGVAMLEQGRKGGFEDGYIAGKAYQKHFASAPPPSSSPSATADATLRAALEKDAARLEWLANARGNLFTPGKTFRASGWRWYGDDGTQHSGATVRELLDAALAGNEGEKS